MPGYAPQLRPQHRQLLELHGISPDIANTRGYTSVVHARELGQYGFASEQRTRAPGLIAPVYDLHGNHIATAFWPDTPRVENGVLFPFDLPPRTGVVLDVLPTARVGAVDVAIPLYVTDSVIDADAALARGLCAVALLASKSLSLSLGGSPSDALRDIPLAGRQVFLCFANDAERRQPGSLSAAKQLFESEGGVVSVVAIPKGLGPAGGLAALLSAGATTADLPKLVLTQPATQPIPARPPQFVARKGEGMIWHKPRASGTEEVQLSNFTARITREIEYDDGVERGLAFEIEVDFGDVVTVVEIPSTRFAAMTWPLEKLGARAIVTPSGQYHLRQAIQTLSGVVPRTRVYRATGWIATEHGPAFVHAGGAIGAKGVIPGIETAFANPLARYVLPTPTEASVLVERIRTTLSLMDVVSSRVIIPSLAAAFRAVLGDVDVSLFLSGPTGVGKSAVAALVQQHFGAGLGRSNLPESWSSTGNALEEQAFLAKDVLLVVDDFVATDPRQVQRLNETAERLLRAQGNRSGRSRMTSEGNLRPSHPPRGLILSTGEDIPRGQSLNARILHIRMTPSDVDVTRLTDHQQRADRGELAETMAGFITYVAERKDGLRVAERLASLRADVEASHARTKEGIANIALGWQIFLEFAADVGAIFSPQRAELWEHGWNVMREIAEAQRTLQVVHEPVTRFVNLLRTALVSGHAHVAGTDGKMPIDAERWGWRELVANLSLPLPKGQRIGWTDGNNLYLDPEGAHRVAHRMAADSGEPFAPTQLMLKELLWQKGWLVEHEKETRDVHTVRRTLEGVRRDVLFLDVGRFWNYPDTGPGTGVLPSTTPTNPTSSDAVGMVGFTPIEGLPPGSMPDEEEPS